MIDRTKERRTYSWEINYGVLGSLAALPFILLGFSKLLYLVIGISLFVISYLSNRKTHYWLELWEGKLRYSKTRENISKHELEENFMDRFSGKEIELKDVESVKFTFLRSCIEIQLKGGQKITIDLITKPSRLKNDIFAELRKVVAPLEG